MANRLVSVNEANELPSEVQEQLVEPVRTEFETLTTTATNAASSSASSAAAAEVSRLAAEAAAGGYSAAEPLPAIAHNLDVYTNPGRFHQDANSVAAASTNYPAPLAGMLVVEATEGGLAYQEYTTATGTLYTRNKTTTKWLPWIVVRAGATQLRGKVAFIGDSYSSGLGLTPTSLRWSSRYCDQVGLTELNLANSGAGWFNNGVAGNFLSQSNGLTADVGTVIICGGINDTTFDISQGSINTVVSTVVTNVRTKSPLAEIIIIGPMWMDTPPVPDLLMMDARLRIAAGLVGVRYIDNAPYIREHRTDWQLSAGDGHPNAAGSLAIASWVNINISQKSEGASKADFWPIGSSGISVPGPNPTPLASGTIYGARAGWWEIEGVSALNGLCLGWDYIQLGSYRKIQRADVTTSSYVEAHTMRVELFWPGGDMALTYGYWANGASATGALTEGFTRVSARWMGTN